MKALILGCGYLGRRVASRWIEAGHKVAALTRSSEKAQELRDAGVVPIIGDVTNPASLAALPTADVVLYAVEGPGALLCDFERRWEDAAAREALLRTVRAVEREPTLLGASPHWLAVARVARDAGVDSRP